LDGQQASERRLYVLKKGRVAPDSQSPITWLIGNYWAINVIGDLMDD